MQASQASQVLASVIKSHPEDKGWAVFTELMVDRRRIDAYIANVRPSKARTMAVEVKVSRSDFNKELLDPSKRAVWETRASECWFATPKGLLRPDETPEGWGLMEVGSTNKVRRIVKPRQRAVVDCPQDLTLALARRAADRVVLPAGEWVLPNGKTVRAQNIRKLAMAMG